MQQQHKRKLRVRIGKSGQRCSGLFYFRRKGVDEAMRGFYASQTYMKLTDEETGLYAEGSAYVYEMFKEERRTGRLA